jgi:hypothetical protein
MNIEIEDKAFLPDKTDGTPVPNPRQAYYLDQEMETRLGEVVADLDRKPEEYLARFEAFAGTLKGAWAATVLAVGARDLAVITQSRKRARRYVEQISDEELVKHFNEGDWPSYDPTWDRRQLLEAACGVDASQRYPYTGRHNVLLKNALSFGRELPSYQFVDPKAEDEPRNPMPEGMVDYYNSTPGVNQRKKALKEAASEFSSACAVPLHVGIGGRQGQVRGPGKQADQAPRGLRLLLHRSQVE